MSTSDYLPGKDAEFVQWTKSFLTVLLPMCDRIGFPSALHQQLDTENNDFTAKYLVIENPETRTSVAIRRKNDARKVLEITLRQSIAEYISRNHLVTDSDRESLGLPIRKTTRTPAPVATTYPEFEINCSMIRQLTIQFYDQGKQKTKGKPAGQHGAELRWGISDTQVIDAEDLSHSAFDTRTPFTLTFQGHDRGKTVYLCLRWENTRGEKGPWSDIKSAIIP
jgi:hypothetical protein